MVKKSNIWVEIRFSTVCTGAVSSYSDAQVEELNAQIEDLKTKLAAYEANTFKEEEQVSEKLVDDAELLEKFYATQMELEKLTDQSDKVSLDQIGENNIFSEISLFLFRHFNFLASFLLFTKFFISKIETKIYYIIW